MLYSNKLWIDNFSWSLFFGFLVLILFSLLLANLEGFVIFKSVYKCIYWKWVCTGQFFLAYALIYLGQVLFFIRVSISLNVFGLTFLQLFFSIVFNHLAFSLWVENLAQTLDQNASMSAFDGVVFISIFLFLQSQKTFFWFNWNFLLMEFRWANNFLFHKNSLVTLSSCLSSASFAIKVKWFVLWYHFINLVLIEF